MNTTSFEGIYNNTKKSDQGIIQVKNQEAKIKKRKSDLEKHIALLQEREAIRES